MESQTSNKKYSFKILKTDYPNFNLSHAVREVGLAEFKTSTPDLALFIGTQFGVYPRRMYKDLNAFESQKIAILGRTLLSGVQTDIIIYLIQEGMRIEHDRISF